MEKLRALVSLSRSGCDLNLLLPKIDSLEYKDILSFKINDLKDKTKALRISQLKMTLDSVERQFIKFFEEHADKKISDKQLSDIFISQDRIKSIMLLIEKNISCYLR